MSTSGWAYSHKLFHWFICPEQWVLQRNFFLSCLVAGISLTNMWVGLFIADFHIITISASAERVVEKLPHCPLHLEGLNETHWEPEQFGQGRVFPHISWLRAGVRPMKLSLPSALQRVKLILAICRHPSVLVGVLILAPPGHPWAIYCFPILTVCSQREISNQIIPSLKNR